MLAQRSVPIVIGTDSKLEPKILMSLYIVFGTHPVFKFLNFPNINCLKTCLTYISVKEYVIHVMGVLALLNDY